MEKYEEFTRWAAGKGVKRYGIAAHRFEGRGLGIVAQKRIESGATILSVPTSALRTAHTVPQFISKPLASITVHGLLATELSLDKDSSRAPWRAILPTMEDFSSSMPFAGFKVSFELSATSKALLDNQHRKYALDWESAHESFPLISEKEFLYYWCIVNTRTFYYVKPGTQRPKETDDCMALVPFADLFNHTGSGGCHVRFDRKGCTIFADKVYEEGEELYISYGDHSNDFLLVEYGFVLENGRYDHQ